jgi:C4-type Zn-finger protein
MTARHQPIAIARVTCPACGAQMNPHAEKPAVPVIASELAQAD